MQKITLIMATVLFLINSNLKAQDDPNNPGGGILVDGVLASKIDCYSFTEMSFVFSVKDIPKFDKYRIWCNSDLLGEYSYQSFMSTFGGGQFGVHKIFYDKKEQAPSIGLKNFRGDEDQRLEPVRDARVYKAYLAWSLDSNMLGRSRTLKCELEGYNKTGEKEVYENGSNIIVPLYDKGVVLRKAEILCPVVCIQVAKTRKKPAKLCDWDSTLCPVSGKKVDYKIEMVNYSKTIGIIKGGSNVPVKSANTQTKPKSTNIPTKLADGLIPYLEKWDNGKIKVQGQKNQKDENEGTWKYYDETGKLWRTEEYKNNEVISSKDE